MSQSDLRMRLTGHDSRGRSTLHRLNPFRMLDVLTGAGLRPREVPSEHWKAHEGAGDTVAVTVQCVCGEEKVADLAVFSSECRCGRRFFYDGTHVWSLIAPREEPAA